uniref:Lanthionine synthetase C family protein n=1 Tax=Cyanothece sp. (strain PCC 7425 / ATCC 29141) TaxID=395961 RepID=B8HM21_CYAP4
MLQTAESETKSLQPIWSGSHSLFTSLLSANPNFSAAPMENAQLEARLKRWCEVIAQGNWDKFKRRLQWDGLDLEQVRSLLDGSPQESEPEWTETLQAIMAASRSGMQPEPSPIDPENPQPFEDLWLPAIAVARQKLLVHLEQTPVFLTEVALHQLERSLLQRLVGISIKTLDAEFSRTRPLGQNLLTQLMGTVAKNSGNEKYQAFISKHLADGLLSFFSTYPVLARLVTTALEFWVEATAEFLQRLAKDLEQIQARFHIQEPQVTAIQLNLSDSHKRGRSVFILTFTRGEKLVYKPKDLSLEAAYSDLLIWCNQNGAPLPFKPLNVLNRGSYGWVEFIEQQPCSDYLAAQRFYQRAGMLLCLLYVLRGTDCHHENLIAWGEHPMLIDMETLLHHQANLLDETETADLAGLSFFNSVLRVGLLPRWDFNKDNRVAYDISGLGSDVNQSAPRKAARWQGINTDDMHLSYQEVPLPPCKNLALLNGQPLAIADYQEDFLNGFEQMYQFLVSHRAQLLAADSPLRLFQDQPIRFVFRATMVYGVILQNTCAPDLLKSGCDRSIELDILSRAFLTVLQKPDAWPILHAELRAMEQLDIPYFVASSSSDALVLEDGTEIPHYFKAPSYDQMIACLEQLGQADLDRQMALIRGVLAAKIARPVGFQAHSSTAATAANWQDLEPLSRDALIQQAQAIAAEIASRAIRGSDGRVNWLGLSYVPNAERFQLQLLSHNLYEGNCGIALFLVAVDHLTNSDRYREPVLAALQPFRQILHRQEPEILQRMVQRMGLGGSSGVGSMIYCLVKISQLLNEPTLLSDAHLLARLITPKLIAADQSLDLIGGAAGAIVGLLSLFSVTHDPEVLAIAIACGQHLLQQQVSINGSPKAWKTTADCPLTGYSHGAAGIAYALLKLYEASKDMAYLDAAVEAIAYEQSVFSAAVGNWPDFRSFAFVNGKPGFMSSWCHGAPGIALARLGGLPILDTPEIRRDLEVALHTTANNQFFGVDHLCCGTFGRIEVLLLAAELGLPSGESNWQDIAFRQATWVVQRAERTGTFHLFANLPQPIYHPGFMQGTAGIGYQLLRLVEPTLPSVLLWQ